MRANLRHLRVFLAVAEQGSVTRAADICRITQPAVTQAIAKLEAWAGLTLFLRTPQGFFLSKAGENLLLRVRRALAILDPVLLETSPRLLLTATSTQLRGLISMRETENYTLAARQLGIAQPTLHRTVTQLEEESGVALLTRTAHGMIATKTAQAMAQAARLAFAELDQAETDLHEMNGKEVGKIVVGAMPLSRSKVLPQAIVAFRKQRPNLPLKILDGPYDDLLAGLRRSEIDFLIGALRTPAPIDDIVQRPLFSDSLVLLARKKHPIFKNMPVTLEQLAKYPWITPPEGTPTRQLFDRIFAPLGKTFNASLTESGSLILLRELLLTSDHLGCISRQQAETEARNHDLAIINFPMDKTLRPIGLTLRKDWLPTRAQQDFIHAIEQAAAT
jgi:LysR family transcriptional regulator, regulator for genes of the gallate degradation pathway